MNFNVYDASEWQFVSGQQSMSATLDPLNGSAVVLDLFSDSDVRVVATTVDGSELYYWEGKRFSGEIHVLGFEKVEIRSRKTANYAVKLFVTSNLEAEYNDGEAVIMEPDILPDMRIDREVQQRLIAELMASGFSHEDTMDILEGLNSDDDELLVDDDFDLPSEAEMNEMIDQARRTAAEQPPEAPPEDSAPEPTSEEEEPS